jgi:hypothetical protein
MTRKEVRSLETCRANRVRHVIGHLSDSTQSRGEREACPWAIQLTRQRKPTGTIACWKRRDGLKACRA